MYMKLLKFAQDLVKTEQATMFKVNKFQVMHASIALHKMKQNKDTMNVMRPGSGKSFAILLIAAYLAKYEPQMKVAIVLLNETLLEQIRIQSNQFDIPKVNFRLYKELSKGENFDVVLYDEYYHHVRIFKLMFGTDGKLEAPFNFHNMGKRRMLFGGHSDSQF